MQINWLVSLGLAVALSLTAKAITWLLAWSSGRLMKAREDQLRREIAELGHVHEHIGLVSLVLGPLMWILIFLAAASAIGTLGNLPERVVPEGPSVALSALSTLFYLLAVLRGVDVLQKLSKLRALAAIKGSAT